MHLKKKIIYFLSLCLTLFKAPLALTISTMTALEKLQIDYNWAGYTLSSSGAQVSVFFPLYQGKQSLLWGGGRYWAQNKAVIKKNSSGKMEFERLSGGFGYRCLYDSTKIMGFYCYGYDGLDARYYRSDHDKQPKSQANYMRINPGFEWISEWTKFNLDGYYLFTQTIDDPQTRLIQDRYGISFKWSSTSFHQINPFIVAYYGQIDRYVENVGIEGEGVKGIGIGAHWAVHPWVNVEIAPVIFDTLHRWSCFATFSLRFNDAKVNTMSSYKRLHQPVSRYQPLYVV